MTGIWLLNGITQHDTTSFRFLAYCDAQPIGLVGLPDTPYRLFEIITTYQDSHLNYHICVNDKLPGDLLHDQRLVYFIFDSNLPLPSKFYIRGGVLSFLISCLLICKSQSHSGSESEEWRFLSPHIFQHTLPYKLTLSL